MTGAGVIESVESVQTIADLRTSTGPAGVIMMARGGAECNFMIMLLQSGTAPYCPIWSLQFSGKMPGHRT